MFVCQLAHGLEYAECLFGDLREMPFIGFMYDFVFIVQHHVFDGGGTYVNSYSQNSFSVPVIVFCSMVYGGNAESTAMPFFSVFLYDTTLISNYTNKIIAHLRRKVKEKLNEKNAARIFISMI